MYLKPLAAVLPDALAGLDALWHRGHRHAALAQKPANEPPLTPETKRLLFLESFLGNFLFTHLHDLRREPDRCGFGRRHHGGHSCCCGVDGLGILGERVAPTLDGRALRRGGHRPVFTIKTRAIAAHMETNAWSQNTANHAW